MQKQDGKIGKDTFAKKQKAFSKKLKPFSMIKLNNDNKENRY